MIKAIKLKFGRAPSLGPEILEITPITVFVGPNNSGKSRVLAEIDRFCRRGQKDRTDVIVDSIEFYNFTLDDAKKKIQKVKLSPRPNDAIQPDHIYVGRGTQRKNVPEQQLLTSFQNTKNLTAEFCQWYLTFNTLMLDGKNRINLINQQDAGDLQEHPQNNGLQVLFQDQEKRLEVRRIIYDAFSLYFVVDPTNLGKLRINLSAKQPKDYLEEIGIHPDAIKFHSEAQSISQASDGVKAFTGIITEIIAGDPSILLIDEPEAFLHPSLSHILGKEVAQASSSSEKRLFVSTHSPNFVMGCIQSGVPVNIVRLTYRDEVATARVLPNDDILKLMRNPLLRSTNVLNGLFYEFVIVTESDTDRAFYQEINERLLRYKPELGIPNCLFINAQNKQTVQTIIRPLRELGIPSVGIVDIDILKEGGTVWTNFLASGFVPELWHQSLSTLRSKTKKKLEETGKDMKRDGGVNLLKDVDKEGLNNLFNQLNEYGLFVVREGEIESWLKNLEATGHGPNWLIEIFEKMGEDPDSNEYLKPFEGDVWSFIGEIKQWLTNANRKGIPS